MPQQLTGGRHLRLTEHAQAGRLRLGRALSGAAVAPLRSGRILLGRPLCAAGVVLAVDSGVMRIGKIGCPVGAVEPVRRGRLRIVVSASAVGISRHTDIGRSVIVGWPARITEASPPLAAIGPGQSAGETVPPLPAVWLARTWPDQFIGRDLAALAVLRGEPWELSGAYLVVAGRVMVGESGAEIPFEGAADLDDWIGERMGELAGYLGIMALPAGWREWLISKHRQRVASAVNRGAKMAAKIADGPRRAALLADLDWIQGRV